MAIALRDGHINQFNLEQLQALVPLLPTSLEVEAANAHTKDWGKDADGFPQRPVDHSVEITEAWMIAVSQVPKLDDSCDSILLMKEFPATVV